MKAFGLLEKRLEGAGSASMKQYRKVLKNKGNREICQAAHEDSGKLMLFPSLEGQY